MSSKDIFQIAGKLFFFIFFLHPYSKKPAEHVQLAF